MNNELPLPDDELMMMFPRPLIRGARISRQDLRRVQGFRLNAETAGKLGRYHLGVLVADCRPLAQMLPSFGRLAAAHSPVRYVVVPDSYVELSQLLSLGNNGRAPDVQCLVPNAVWSCGSCLFSLSERLPILSQLALDQNWQIGAVIVWDPFLRLHRQRRPMQAVRRRTDIRRRDCRPANEPILQLRYEHRRGDWRPPLFLCTQRQLRSIDSQALSVRYGIEACWYVDGETLRCGEPEAEGDADPPGARQFQACGPV